MTDIADRAKLRTNQQNRLDRAVDTIEALIKLHMPNDHGDREAAELHMLQMRLTALIKHQHVKDEGYKQYRIVEDSGY